MDGRHVQGGRPPRGGPWGRARKKSGGPSPPKKRPMARLWPSSSGTRCLAVATRLQLPSESSTSDASDSSVSTCSTDEGVDSLF